MHLRANLGGGSGGNDANSNGAGTRPPKGIDKPGLQMDYWRNMMARVDGGQVRVLSMIANDVEGGSIRWTVVGVLHFTM